MSKKIPVLITTDKRGVFMGYIDEKSANDEILIADDVRMCVYWSADVKGILGLASSGPTKTCKITKAVPKARIRGITSVMDITKDAEKEWNKNHWG
jgi:hypothetical protein